MMNLVAIPNVVGGHLGGWRHPQSFTDTVMSLECVTELAQIAECGKLDAIFLADGNAVREMECPPLFAANFPSARPAGFEPTTLFAALSMVTRNIGFVATATSTYDAPYLPRSHQQGSRRLEPGDRLERRRRTEFRPQRTHVPRRPL
jgi:hypothetical protein